MRSLVATRLRKYGKGWELGRGALGDGSVGGGELVRDSTRLVSDEVGSTTVDSEIKGFKGDVAVSSCVAVID